METLYQPSLQNCRDATLHAGTLESPLGTAAKEQLSYSSRCAGNTAGAASGNKLGERPENNKRPFDATETEDENVNAQGSAKDSLEIRKKKRHMSKKPSLA